MTTTKTPLSGVVSGVWSSGIGAQLRRYREAHGLTRVDLGSRLHVSETTIRRWEAGVNRPTAKNLDRILWLLYPPKPAPEYIPPTRVSKRRRVWPVILTAATILLALGLLALLLP